MPRRGETTTGQRDGNTPRYTNTIRERRHTSGEGGPRKEQVRELSGHHLPVGFGRGERPFEGSCRIPRSLGNVLIA